MNHPSCLSMYENFIRYNCILNEKFPPHCCSVLWLYYGLHDARYESRQEEEVYLFSKTVDTGSKAHPTSYSTGEQGDLQPQKKGPGHEADYSPPSSAQIANEWKCTSTYPVCIYREKFTFLCRHFFQKSSSGTILVRLPFISHMITMRFAFTTKKPTPPVYMGIRRDVHQCSIVHCQRVKFWVLHYHTSMVWCINQLYWLLLVHISSRDLYKRKFHLSQFFCSSPVHEVCFSLLSWSMQQILL